MDKKIEFIEKNVVIIAHEYNLSKINNIWLYKNKIFTEEELKGNISSPLLFEVHSKDFMFQINPERIQFSIFSKNKKYDDIIVSKINKLINLIPNTPFSAIGFNYIYHYYSNSKNIHEISKELFFFKESTIAKEFNTDDARFGGYFSKNINGFRLKLDVKPINFFIKNIKNERIQFAFNFHKVITIEEDYKTILDILKKWKETKAKADSILTKIN